MKDRQAFDRSLIVILLTVSLDAVGIGLVMPVMPGLLRELSPSAHAAGQYGYFLALYSLMQFLFSPVLGRLSDRHGRRPILLISLAGAAADYLVMATAPQLWVLYVGRIIAGITGANMAVATAYITDISGEEERVRRFGYLNASFGLGFIAGPMLGGLAGAVSPRYPFLLAALFNGLNLLLGYFLLPESRSSDKRSEAPDHRSLNPISSLRWVWGMKSILPLMAIYLVVQFVGEIQGTIWVMNGEDRFGWGPWMVGLSLAGFGILHATVQAFVAGRVTKWLGERRAIQIGLSSDGVGCLLMAFAAYGRQVFPCMIFLALGGIAMPALQSLLTKQVSEDKQGELQGTLVSLLSIASVFGPISATELYAACLGSWTGYVWIVAACLYLLCFPLLRRGVIRESLVCRPIPETLISPEENPEAVSSSGDGDCYAFRDFA